MFTYFYLESFDDHELNTPGVTASAGATAVRSGFSGSRIDQVGLAGGCPVDRLDCDTWFSEDGATGISFTFDAAVLGTLPNAVGIVWTDGAGMITFEAFDQNGVSLGIVIGDHADVSNSGTIGDDRFYGVTNPGGISRIHIRNSSGGIEVDDLQYGFVAETPIANAGADQTAAEATNVTLDGSASTGDTLSYRWTQVAGPTVGELAMTASPGFRAPAVPPGGATVTFALVVCVSTTTNCSDPDTVNVQIGNVNQAPVAQAGEDQTVREGDPVRLDGRASYDVDLEAVTYSWAQVSGQAVILDDPLAAEPTFTAPPVGTSGDRLDFALVVTDPHGLSSHVDHVSVVVTNVNQPPMADAGPDQTKYEETVVTLDGSASQDPDLEVLRYTWTQRPQPGVPMVALAGADTVSPTFMAPGVPAGGVLLTFDLTVEDAEGSQAVDSVQIAVRDLNDPPACSLAQASPNLLWPPNHTMTEVRIVGLTDASNQTLAITYQGVTQDEPTDGLGDGDSSPDAAVSGNNILLRAERAGGGDGRVYVVHFTATDAQGAQCSGNVKVTVPNDKKDPAIEGPQIYDAFLP